MSISLQPTSPLRDAKDIDNAIEFMFEKNGDAVNALKNLNNFL